MPNSIDFHADPGGQTVIVDFVIEKVIADWAASHVRGAQKVEMWSGRTDDQIADVAVLDPKAVLAGDDVGWTVLLFGPSVAMTVQVLIEVRQPGRPTGQSVVSVDLPAKKAVSVTGTVHFT